MGALHDHSQQYRSETNGIIERCVGKVTEGTTVVRGQSGLAEAWWSYAMMYFCFISNVLDILVDGKTSYENRWGRKFAGPIYPFGCEVDYHAIGPDKGRCFRYGTKTLPGIFLGYVQKKDGGDWQDDLLMVIDQHELEEAETFSDVRNIRWCKSKEGSNFGHQNPNPVSNGPRGHSGLL